MPWTQVDEARPDVELGEIPEALSERGQRVLALNPRLRGIWDEGLNSYPSDSERALAFSYHAGYAGLTKEDAARLLVEFYGRPGKKRLHRTKLTKTLRAWAKGREQAQREDGEPSAATDVEPERETPDTGAEPREPRKASREVEPYECLPGPEFMRASFAGATRLVPSIGLTEAGVGLLTGGGGEGKSVCGLNLSLAWTGLTLPLGAAIPVARRLRVMDFPVEDAPGMVQERLRTILGSTPIPDSLFLFTRREPMRLSGARGRPNVRALERLAATLARHAPVDLVVFDPLVYLHEAEENSSSEMMRWLVPLREVCRQAGAALLIVHHAGWAADGDDARGRGSTAIRAWSDFELALRAQPKGGRILHRLNLVKANFAPRWKEPLTLELDEKTLVFTPVDETETLCSTSALVEWMLEDLHGIWAGKRLEFYQEVCKHFRCSNATARAATATAIREGRLVDRGQRKPLEVVSNSQEALL